LAWSDAELGIGIGWMYPGDSIIRGKKYIPNVNIPNDNNYTTLLYPEFNRYSRVGFGEDEAGLVFVGKLSNAVNDTNTHIFYTRVRVDSTGNIEYFLPQNICYGTSDSLHYDITNKITMVTSGSIGTYHRNPKIIRNIAEYNMPNQIDNKAGNLAYKMDRIVWEANDQEGKSIIQMVGYDFEDAVIMDSLGIHYEPYCYTTKIPTIIRALDGNLEHPSITQGTMKWQPYFNGLDTIQINTYYNDSAMVMTFGGFDSLMYQIPQNYWTLTNGGMFDLQTIPNINQLTATGKYPTLPTLATVKDDSLYQYLRIFYQDDSSNGRESTEYFAKSQYFNKGYNLFFGINSSNQKSKLFTPIVTMNEKGTLEYPKMKIYDNVRGQYRLRDTIATEWFEVSGMKSIDYIEKGDLNKDYSMQIQRQRDGKLYPLSLSKESDNKMRIKTKMLLNGKKDKYRLIWIADRSKLKVTEQLVIGKLAEKAMLDGELENRELGKEIAVGTDEILDLNNESYATNDTKMQLLAYPNPVNDELFVIVYLPQTDVMKGEDSGEINVRLYDVQGKEVFTQATNPGQIIRISTKEMANGTYYLRAIPTNNHQLPIELQNIIIQK
jgi:hypothetical protein